MACFVRTNTQSLHVDDTKGEDKSFERIWDRKLTFLHKIFCCESVLLCDWLIISFVISCDLWERSENPLIFTPECFHRGAERMGNASVMMSSLIRQARFIYLSQKSMKYYGCHSFTGVGLILLLHIVPSLRTSYLFIPELPLCFGGKHLASSLIRRSRAQCTCRCQSIFIGHLWGNNQSFANFDSERECSTW